MVMTPVREDLELAEVQKRLDELKKHGHGDLNIRVSDARVVYIEVVLGYKVPRVS